MVYVVFVADGEKHNMAFKKVLYVWKVRVRIISKRQYRFYSFKSNSEWSNLVQEGFLLGSACNLSN